MRRITVLVGAGAVLEVGAPSTLAITKEVRKCVQLSGNMKRSFIDEIAVLLTAYYNQRDTITFEDIYHALEQISTYRLAWLAASKPFKPAFGAFCKPADPKLFKDSLVMIQAERQFISCIAEMINNYDSTALTVPKNEWHSQFWRGLSTTRVLEVATLNYDTTIEQILPGLSDGFEPTAFGFSRFNPAKLSSERESGKILHLHGAINYGYSRTPNVNEYVMEDDHEDLYKYGSYGQAKTTWTGRSGNTSQSGERAQIGPIITGLSKTDKLLANPYMFYHSAFTESVLKNHVLIIIGYSFGDHYINCVLQRMARIHGDGRRIVFILKGPVEKMERRQWTNDMPRAMFLNIVLAFGEDNIRWIYEQEPPYTSSKGFAKLYIGGFEETVKKYSNEIQAFIDS